MEKVKEIIKMGDFFNSFQMLRYNRETQYRTFTGGLISMGIIITIIIAFASMILNTINRTTISFTLNTERAIDPPLSTITASTKNNFMFGV